MTIDTTATTIVVTTGARRAVGWIPALTGDPTAYTGLVLKARLAASATEAVATVDWTFEILFASGGPSGSAPFTDFQQVITLPNDSTLTPVEVTIPLTDFDNAHLSLEQVLARLTGTASGATGSRCLSFAGFALDDGPPAGQTHTLKVASVRLEVIPATTTVMGIVGEQTAGTPYSFGGGNDWTQVDFTMPVPDGPTQWRPSLALYTQVDERTPAIPGSSTFVGKTVLTTNNVTGVALPPGTLPGDLLCLSIGTGGFGEVPTCSDGRIIQQNTLGNFLVGWGYADESTSPLSVHSVDGENNGRAVLVAYRVTGLVEAVVSASVTPPWAPTMPTATAGIMVACYSQTLSGVSTTEDGWTLDADGHGANCYSQVWSKAALSPFSFTNTGPWNAIVLGISDQAEEPDPVWVQEDLEPDTDIYLDCIYIPENGKSVATEPYLDGDQPYGLWEGQQWDATSLLVPVRPGLPPGVASPDSYSGRYGQATQTGSWPVLYDDDDETYLDAHGDEVDMLFTTPVGSGVGTDADVVVRLRIQQPAGTTGDRRLTINGYDSTFADGAVFANWVVRLPDTVWYDVDLPIGPKVGTTLGSIVYLPDDTHAAGDPASTHWVAFENHTSPNWDTDGTDNDDPWPLLLASLAAGTLEFDVTGAIDHTLISEFTIAVPGA